MFSGKWAEKDAVNRILKRSIEDCQPLNTWKFVKYQYEGLNKYQKISEGKIGFDEMWDIDGTYNFYREISVPVTENMKNWYLVFEIGGECEVYVNDIPVGSLDTNHKEILIAENTFGGERFQIRVQATRHEHEYVRSERMNGKSYGYHIFQNVSLISRRREIEQFAYMAKIILEFMECDFLGEEKRLELHEILKEVLYEIDYFADIDTLEKQVIAGRGLILEKIHNCSIHVPFDESLYMGHSHLDLAFKWTYKETYRKMERTLSNTVSLMERHQQITYIQSQMHIIETLAKDFPELFHRIKKLISAGKLEVVGDAYVEFDTNIPSGESLIRQFLVGKNLAKKLTGTNSKVCYLPDTFGYSGILPQILKQVGFQYFVTAKLSWNDTNPPENFTFLWKGIDGSGIKVHLIDSYGGDPRPERMSQRCKDSRCHKQPVEYCHVYQYGAGDGGGGISEENVMYLQAMEALDVFTKIQHVTLEQAMEYMFQDVLEEQLPVVDGELYFERHRGVYTSQGKIKKGNRTLEKMLHRLEVLHALAHLQGKEYEKEELQAVWKVLLFQQFHDIIAGSCIHQAIVEAEEAFATGIRTCEERISQIERDLCTGKDMITIFNPSGVTSGKLMKVKLPYPIEELDGNPVQIMKEVDGSYWGYAKIQPLSPLGSRKLKLGKPIVWKPVKPIEITFLENSRYRIQFDGKGEITELYDKYYRKQVLRGKGNMLRAHVDRGGYFESWDITTDIERKVYDIDQVEHMLLIEDGPVRKTIQIKKKFKSSFILQNISIYEDSARIDFDTKVEFREKQMLLKAGFDVDVDAPFATYDISMGNLQRETTRNTSIEKAKYEVCTHKFMDLSEDNYGVAVLNDCKYGCDVAGNRMRITLIKTSTFPDESQDIGEHEFCYSLLPHVGDVKAGMVREEAYHFHQMPYLIMGEMSLPEEVLMYEEQGVVLETVKKAENEEAIILRFYEHHGEEKEVKLYWNGPISRVIKCNVLEEPMDMDDSVRLEDQNIYIKFKPYEIVTIQI